MKKSLLLICLLLLLFCGACAEGNKTDILENENTNTNTNTNLAINTITDENTVIDQSQDIAKDLIDDLEESFALANAADVIEIREKMFIAQTNDIMLNARSYEGKTVKVEGMYFGYFDPYSEREYHYVQRRSPGCCGNDGLVGFEIIYEGEMPEINDWVEAIGKVEVVKVGNDDSARLHLSVLTVKNERGAEFVRF